LGRQIIIDVAVTGIDGQSRTSDEAVERPLQARYDQKLAKYGHVAEQNNLRFILTLVKFMTTSKLLLESRFDTS
tara:strand:+ start:631 stop:852 length:222 start_codon:yes stop_codon:yes gene_type:complete